MGPTTTALLNYHRADLAVREAKGRLETASKDVRVQQHKVKALTDRLTDLQTKLKETQSKVGLLDLDVKARLAHIERLREQQNATHNNKEYQTFLIEINTQKVDKAKVEEELFKLMEAGEKSGVEVHELEALVAQESAKLDEIHSKINDRLIELQKQIDEQTPARETAGALLPDRVRTTFDTINDRLDGDGMAAIEQHDMRRAEYSCTACNMELVVDIFNKLLTRDDIIYCPSCRRVLFIPDSMPKEVTTKTTSTRKKTTTTRTRKPKVTSTAAASADATDVRVDNKWFDIVTRSQGESVRGAKDADQSPVECKVTINGELVGTYKGKSAENLQRVILFIMSEKGITAEVNVELIPETESTEAAPSGEAPSGDAPSAETPVEAASEQSNG